MAVGTLVWAAATGPIDGPAAVQRVAVRADPAARVLVVSDSAWLGIKTYGAIDAVRGFPHELDLASCRRRVVTSCRNFDGHVPIPLIDEVRLRGDTFDTLVVATGYNDTDGAFTDEVAQIVGLARSNGYRRIVWLTLRSNVSYQSPGNAGFADVFERSNDAIRSLAGSTDYPDVVVADWATYARDRPEWFSNDGIHLRIDGPWAAADYISRKLAFLDGRVCPMPSRAGDTSTGACPDPDAAPPSVDLRSLYPIGEQNPTAGFFIEWSGRSSWPEPPWWFDRDR